MEPLDQIVTAIVAGTAGASGKVIELGIQDAYKGLVGLIRSKFGGDSEVSKAIEAVEKRPDSEGRRATLKEEVDAAAVHQDDAIVALARELLEKVQQQPDGPQYVQQIAQGVNIAQASHGGTATVRVNQPAE